MIIDRLIQETRERFPSYSESSFDVHELEKGGSDRKYYRIRCNPLTSLILVKYNIQKPENARFVAVANFLDGVGVSAPLVYFHDSEEGLIWMQDLGDEDLWLHRSESWAIRRELYRRTLDQAITLHRTDPRLWHLRSGLAEFDFRLYRWEQEYGVKNCFGRYFGLSGTVCADLLGHSALVALAEELSSHPRVLIHRDLQSQNVLVCDDQPYLIDFQGMRPGLGTYDLASLIFDPYVQLTEAEQAELVDYYRAEIGSNGSDDTFRRRLLQCALQRLFQALGAYGVIGLIRGKPEFLRHIRPAISRLEMVASELAEFSFFRAFLGELPPSPRNTSDY